MDHLLGRFSSVNGRVAVPRRGIRTDASVVLAFALGLGSPLFPLPEGHQPILW